MNVLHVYAGNLFGGVESMLVALAAVPAERSGLRHTFALCFDERLATELRALGQTVHLLGPVRMSRPVSAHTARRRLDAILRAADPRFDAVICHAPWAEAAFGGVVRRAGVPLAFWAHNVMTGRHWTERLARLTPPDLVICNSAFTESTRRALYPTTPSVVVHPAARLAGPARERRYLRMSLDTPQDAIVIVQASRCDPAKGQRLLLEALSAMRPVARWVCWMAGGAQRSQDAAYLAELRAFAERAAIADRVRWLGERRDVPTLLAAADIYCQPNLEPESFGLSFVEALAAGLPVVSIRHGGACEIVDDGCGVLVAAKPDPIARALTHLVTEPAAREALARRAPARAVALSDPLVQAQRLHDALAAIAPRLRRAG